MKTRSSVSGAGIDRELGRIRINVLLERNQIVGVVLHLRQPVDDKLVRLLAIKAELRERILEERRGVLPRNAEAGGKVVIRPRRALPVEVAVGLAALVRQRAIRRGADAPAVTVGGDRRTSARRKIKRHTHIRLLLGI